MEEKEIKVEVPKGYCIDKEKSTFEKIVFKKKDNKPRSWEEYCHNFRGEFYYIKDNENNIGKSSTFTSYGLESIYRNTLPSKVLAEAFLAMMQLMSLRQAWIGDWKPDWNDNKKKNCIIIFDNKFNIEPFSRYHQVLSFPTEEMAKEFMNCFRDLLNVAKPLI